jgi:hypothetical protein
MDMSIPEIFDALIQQTLQRGGCPSVNTVSHAAIVCDNIITCWTEVREHTVKSGMHPELAKAIKAMDAAVESYEGK